MNIYNERRPTSSSSSHLNWSHQYTGEIGLSSSILPTHNSMGWGSLKLSLASLEILGFGYHLALSSSWPSFFTVCREPDASWITCQLCDFRQVMFAFGDSVPSSRNEHLNWEKVGKCLQESGMYQEGVLQIPLMSDNVEWWQLQPTGKGTPGRGRSFYSSPADCCVGRRTQYGHISSFLKRCRKSGFLCEIFQFLNVGTNIFRNTKWAKLNTSVCRIQPWASRVQPLDQTMANVFAISKRIWPCGRLSLQSVCFWLSLLFLLQFKQSGRGLKCNCVYKHPEEFHMVCRMWSWLNLKRLNVLRQLQSCLFCKSMQFVDGSPGRDERWEMQLVWPVSPVVGAEEASQVAGALPNTHLFLSAPYTHVLSLSPSPCPSPSSDLVSSLLIWTSSIFTHSEAMLEMLNNLGPGISTDWGRLSHAEARN